MIGYIDTPVRNQYMIEVDNTHTLYVEECGCPTGIPVVFLHGGPGGEISEFSRRFFDPAVYRIILFDQRGTGKSKPFLSLENNTVLDSVQDMEKIRQALAIKKWIVFGGSYGSTLALAYAIQFPQYVLHLVLRGIFLGRSSDIAWLCSKTGAAQFFPEEFERFTSFIPEEEQEDLITAYYQRMIGNNQRLAQLACWHWSQWEKSLISLTPHLTEFNEPDVISKSDLSIGLLEAHYFYHHMFWGEDNYLLNRVNRLKNIPIDIIHGRFDIDCRVSGAYELAKKCPHAHLHIIQPGAHTPVDKELFIPLLEVMESIKQRYI